jgi:hypothetical protein
VAGTTAGTDRLVLVSAGEAAIIATLPRVTGLVACKPAWRATNLSRLPTRFTDALGVAERPAVHAGELGVLSARLIGATRCDTLAEPPVWNRPLAAARFAAITGGLARLAAGDADIILIVKDGAVAKRARWLRLSPEWNTSPGYDVAK